MRVSFDLPEAITDYVDLNDPEHQLKMRELFMFSLIQENKLSFGKAAELLGIGKMKLITDLGQAGLPYFDQPLDDVLADSVTARGLSEVQ